MQQVRRVTFVVAVVLTSACGRTPSPDIRFVGSSPPTAVEVRGLPAGDVAALAGRSLTATQWQRILQVTAQGSNIPIPGEYAASERVIRFTPKYGFESWRPYRVRFDASHIPGAKSSERWRRQLISKVFTFAGTSAGRQTAVEQVYPSGSELPENTRRFHIKFSAPMGRASALDYVRLIDEDGNHVLDPFLPIEADSWTADRTRVRLALDPARVKGRTIPGRGPGRALVAGKRYALVIAERWFDARGRPLQSRYRHEFTVVSPLERPLDARAWNIQAPASGTRDPLVVTFPRPLDYGLLHRALGIRRAGAEVPGEIAIADGETSWSFIPRDLWTPGDYSLFALSTLEDPAGNRLGQAFDAMDPGAEDHSSIEIPFAIK